MPSLAAPGLGRAIVPVSVRAAHKHLKVIADDLTIDGQPLARQVSSAGAAIQKDRRFYTAFARRGFRPG